jgi:Sigma-70, region 4
VSRRCRICRKRRPYSDHGNCHLCLVCAIERRYVNRGVGPRNTGGELPDGGLSYYEIAQRMGTTHTTIWNIEQRALDKLRILLLDPEEWDESEKKHAREA